MDQALSVLLSSQSQDWYTPPQYIEAARRVMGGIDLDPASSAVANQVIKATTFYDETADGLAQPWRGRIWLNPPYGKQGGTSNQEIWTRRLIQEYKAGNVQQAIALVNFVPGYKWWAPLWAYPVCSVGHCIRFLRADGQPAGSAKASSAFVYLGPHYNNFEAEFSEFGYVGMLRQDRKPICPVCKTSFEQKTWGGSNRRYCSTGCRQKAYRQRATSSVTRV